MSLRELNARLRAENARRQDVGEAPPTAPATLDGPRSLRGTFGGADFREVGVRLSALGWPVYPQERVGERKSALMGGRRLRWMEEEHLDKGPAHRGAVESWARNSYDHNTALVCGHGTKVMAIDADVLDPETETTVDGVMCDVLGPSAFLRVGREPKAAWLYRWEGEPGCNEVWLLEENFGDERQAIEILSQGKSLTVTGKHHSTGYPFKWIGLGKPNDLWSATPADLPTITREKLAAFREALVAAGIALRQKAHAGDVAWDISTIPDTGIRVPRPRMSGTVPWVVEDGKVVDGRDGYLLRLCLEAVLCNPRAALDETRHRELHAAVIKVFTETASLEGWSGRVYRETPLKVASAAAKLASKEFSPRGVRVDAEGRGTIEPKVALPGERTDGDLEFLPPRGERERMRVKIDSRDNGEDNALQPDRTAIAAEISGALDGAYDKWLAGIRQGGEPGVLLVKAPTGAGKTSRFIEAAARDAASRPFAGPIVFLAPSYANIDEIRARAKSLGFDADMSDDQMEAAATGMGLLPAGKIDAAVADMQRQAAEAGLRTMVYRGKVAAGCLVADKMKKLQSAGIAASGLCEADVRDSLSGETSTKRCPHYDGCPAIAQRAQIAQSHIVFAPHAFFALNIPAELKAARAVVADERVHHLFLHSLVMDLDVLDDPRSPRPRKADMEGISWKDRDAVAHGLETQRRIVADIAKKALLQGEDPASAIAAEAGRVKNFRGQTATLEDLVAHVATARRCCADEAYHGAEVHPGMSETAVDDLIAKPSGRQFKEEHRFWKVVGERLDEIAAQAGKPKAQRKALHARDARIQAQHDVLEKEGGLGPSSLPTKVRVSWRSEPNWGDKPLLLLDASADRRIVRKVFGGRPVDDLLLGVDGNVRTVALIDGTWAKSTLIPAPDASQKNVSERKISEAALRLHDLRTFVTIVAAMYAHGRVLVGSAKSVREILCLGWAPPPNVDWCHFGALRGLDFAKNHVAAISIGRLELPTRAVDGIVAALTYDDDVPEAPLDDGKGLRAEKVRNSLQWVRMEPEIEERMWSMRDNSEIGWEIPVVDAGKHPWAAVVQRQYREEEQSQFLGRLRPVYRSGQAPVWFCVSKIVPGGVILDDVLLLRDVLGGTAPRTSPLWDAIRYYGEIEPVELADKAVDVFADEAAVRAEMARIGFDPVALKLAGRPAWSYPDSPKTPDALDAAAGTVTAQVEAEGRMLDAAYDETRKLPADELRRAESGPRPYRYPMRVGDRDMPVTLRGWAARIALREYLQGRSQPPQPPRPRST